MREIKKIQEELEELEKCCDWNGYNMKATPVYKTLSKELNDDNGSLHDA